jgi:undecaprenyl diphosphate synthase
MNTYTRSEIPKCIAFIMDGNRRYARARGESDVAGHQAGEKTFRQVIDWCQEMGIAHVCTYAFSTENWKRSETEVQSLMSLLSELVAQLHTELQDKPIRVCMVGERSHLNSELMRSIEELERVSASSAYTTTVWIALSYGGRAEIVAGVNHAVMRGVSVSEEEFAAMLWTAEMPDPDLVIRTGGEQRLSNFLTWSSVYSELHFTDTLWPAFTKQEFRRIVEWYGSRARRYGA